MNRREFFTVSTALGLAASTLGAKSESFKFVHLTDTHIEPELHAGEGVRMCFNRVNSLKPDFIISGGDLVFDAADVTPRRANEVFDLWAETAKILHAPVHNLVGNHDVFGVSTKSNVTSADPKYGKGMFEDRIGKRYYSFSHKGWKFIALDSVFITKEKGYIGRIDDDQMTWLTHELASTPKDQPLIVATHIPLVTGFLQYIAQRGPSETMIVTNANEVLDMLWPYNLKAVLQGHTHIRENVTYNGCQFITSGAVCGNWWKGKRMGHPEGFGVLTVHNGNVDWRYETYGFHADPA